MRSRHLGLTLLLVGLLLLVGPAPSHAMTGVPYGGVLASHSGKCLSVEGASRMSEARIVQTACLHKGLDEWQVQPAGDYYQLVNRQSGQCLAIAGGSWLRGWQLVQSTCAVRDHQLVSLVAQNGGYAIRFKRSGLCADVFADGQGDGTPLVQWVCNRTSSQTFQFERGLFATGTSLGLVSAQSGQCANVDPAVVATTGAAAGQRPCAGLPSDTWTMQPVGQGVTLVNRQSGQCLDVSGESQAPGAPIIQWTCKTSGTPNQQWRLQAFGNAWRLVAAHSGQCLRIASATTTPMQLIQSTCTGDAAELWSFHVPTLQAKWSAVIPTSIDPVAAANLPDGRILAWSADQPLWYNKYSTGLTHTEVIDPISNIGSVAVVTNTGHDMFCPGTAMLDDGRVFVNGGLDSGRTSLYDPTTNTWSDGGNMNIGRGYEGTVFNADGTVLTLGGSFSGIGFGNRTGEVWTKNGTWTLMPGLAPAPVLTVDSTFRSDNHLWLQVMSGGRLLHAGPSKQMNWIDPKGNGGQGAIVPAGLRGDDADSMNGNAVAFDVDVLLKFGGARFYENALATTSSLVIDASGGAPVVQRTAPMMYARAYVNSVVLPTGHVVVVGGATRAKLFSDDDAVLVPEIWDPASRVFARLPAMVTPRTYHSVALLMTDGRVWVGGGGLCGSCTVNHANYEILTPPYLLDDGGNAQRRPTIRRVSHATPRLGATIEVATGSPVASFSLVRLSSVTHSLNNDQRRVPLKASTRDGSTYRMTLPADPGVLVPGYYMLFAMNAKGVPSVAYTIRVAAS